MERPLSPDDPPSAAPPAGAAPRRVTPARRPGVDSLLARPPLPWAATGRAAAGAGLALALATWLTTAPGPLRLPAHAATVPLAVGSLYASANDRPGPAARRVGHVLLPALAGALGVAVGAALPGRPGLVAVLAVTALGALAGLLSRGGATGSAAGLQLLALGALGQGLPARHGAWWVPGALVLLGAVPVALALAAATVGRDRPPAAPQPTGSTPGAPRASPLRLASCAGLAAGLDAVTHPLRGYWVLLTVALVVKPDLAPVTQRAAHRALGTLAGSLVVVALLVSGTDAGTDRPLLLLTVTAGTALVPWAAAHSYAALSAAVLPVVFALLALSGATGAGLVGWRLADTAVGLVLALAVGHPWR